MQSQTWTTPDPRLDCRAGIIANYCDLIYRFFTVVAAGEDLLNGAVIERAWLSMSNGLREGLPPIGSL